MTKELVKAQPLTASLPDMVRYAEELANANLLPGQYRRQPANVLYAMEYGRTLGITPLAAITGIHVIEGKPSASSALIGGLVRQAGHKLRVSGNGLTATAEIIRADDPDFTYSVTWELRRNANGNPNAEDAGLMNKQVWKNYPAAMLKARAITQVARDACEEVLFGLHYTPEELGAYVDQDGNPVDAPVQPLRAVEELAPPRDFLAEAQAAETADDVRTLWKEAGEAGAPADYLQQIAEIGQQKAAAEPVDAEVVDDDADHLHDRALDELVSTGLKAGLTLQDLEEGFQAAHGTPMGEATIEALQQMTSVLKAGAA